MKRFVLIILISVGFQAVYSQEDNFVFEDNPYVTDISSVDRTYLKDHPLGKDISARLELLKNVYTYIEPASAVSPSDKTVVMKPVIYNSVVKLNRYYKKKSKNGLIDTEKDKNEFETIINKALILYSEDTENLERDLRKAKEPEEILEVYSRVILK
ncbi:MAG: hypothetical protein JW894_11015 [Bacteroidales bacterium]|nr:hypothetical protein [Bacteroidales bacterium]